MNAYIHLSFLLNWQLDAQTNLRAGIGATHFSNGNTGYYYNRQKVDEVRFETKGTHLLTGKLDQQLMAEDEQLFQQLWRTYFKTIAIKERINPKLHRQNLPVRFWKYLTEK